MGNRIEVDVDRCKGCGLCVLACPREIIELGSDINVKGYHYAVLIDADQCTACKLCGVMCPDVAIIVYRGLKKKPAA